MKRLALLAGTLACRAPPPSPSATSPDGGVSVSARTEREEVEEPPSLTPPPTLTRPLRRRLLLTIEDEGRQRGVAVVGGSGRRVAAVASCALPVAPTAMAAWVVPSGTDIDGGLSPAARPHPRVSTKETSRSARPPVGTGPVARPTAPPPDGGAQGGWARGG